jgi:DNA-binding PadR family transcriptional regulator
LAERIFRRGDLRLFLLGALEDGPKHGYELMRILEERFAGLYRPSAGSVYPRLATLVDAGLVSHDDRDYALTDAGRAEVAARREDLRAIERSMPTPKPAPRGRGGQALRAEVRAAAAEVRAQQRRVTRTERERVSAGSAPLASLRVELRVFGADVLAAARRADAGADAVAAVVRVLDDARRSVVAALVTDNDQD